MKLVSRIFLKGIALVLPIVGTLAIVVWLVGSMESFANWLFSPLFPNGFGIPGIGLLIVVAAVFAIGLLAHLWIFRSVIGLLEGLMSRAPLVKAIYGSLKGFSDFAFPSAGSNRRLGRTVLVRMKNLGIETVGFEMVTDLADHALGKGVEDAGNKVAVYLPMSYQIGGYMAIVPRDSLTPLELTTEEALRLTLTAGVASGPAK